MDQCTREVRLQHWKNIICQCQHRPQGQTAKQWMDENGISEQTYYRWQRTIRQETFAEMTAAEELPAASSQDTEVSFVEIPVSKTLPVPLSGLPHSQLNSRMVFQTDCFQPSCGRCPMLEDYTSVRRIVLACGTVDLRKGIEGLAMIIRDRYKQNPFEKGTLFLFCGRRSDRIKGLLWMGTGFCLLYMRLEAGSFFWPHTTTQAADLTEEQFRYLMLGLNPLEPKVKEVSPAKPF